MIGNFEFEAHANITFGQGLIRNLSEIISKEYKHDRYGIIVDGGVYEHCQWLREALDKVKKSFGTVIIHIYKEKFEPTYGFLDAVKPEFLKNGVAVVDCIIGIGGGSVMDSAKGIATILANEGPAISFRGFPQNLKPSLPVIAIPTTAGTGSEIVYNAVFIESHEKKKLGINTKNNYPVMAILDPEMIAASPVSVIISSGIDALVHTLESFVSVKSNYITRIYSREAFRLIINSLPKLIDDKTNLELCANMQLGASLAIMALSNSSSGPSGGLSYYLGTNFNVPHGIAGGVFIGKITQLNHNSGYLDYSQLFDIIEDRNLTIKGDKEKSQYVVKTIDNLLAKAKIPEKLNVFGVQKNDFQGFYEFATVNLKAAFDFNPVKFSQDDIKKMLEPMFS